MLPRFSNDSNTTPTPTPTPPRNSGLAKMLRYSAASREIPSGGVTSNWVGAAGSVTGRRCAPPFRPSRMSGCMQGYPPLASAPLPCPSSNPCRRASVLRLPWHRSPGNPRMDVAAWDVFLGGYLKNLGFFLVIFFWYLRFLE